jgi:hypothetical protein
MKHKFTYEIEYKRPYEMFHKTYIDTVTAEDWHTAMWSIQAYTFHRLGDDITVIGVRLLKED